MTVKHRPFPHNDIRIGHRGLERRDVDDTYWLNGTQIERSMYDVELQRSLAYAAERQQQAALIQAQQINNDTARRKYEAMQNTPIQALYGYSITRNVFDAMNVIDNQRNQRETQRLADHRDASAPTVRGDSTHAEAEKVETLRERIAAGKERLTLKNTPLFGHMRWRFVSPLHELRMWLFRWLYRSRMRSRTA